MTEPRRPDMADPRGPEQRAFERQMAAVLDDMGAPDPRFDAMSIVRIATAPTRRSRSETVFAALRFSLAGLLVGVVGTLALLVVLQDDPSVVPAASPSPSSSPTITDIVDLPIEGAGATTSTHDSIWIASEDRVVRVDPATRTVIDTIEGVGPDPIELFATEDTIWAITTDSAIAIDRATNGVVATIDAVALAQDELGDATFTTHSVAAAPLIVDGVLWVQLDAVEGASFLVGIDLETAELELHALPTSFAALWSVEVDGRIWSFHPAVLGDPAVLSSFDLEARTFDADVIEVDVRPPRPCCLVADGALFIIDDSELVRVDLATRTITDRIPTGGGIREGVVAGGAIWLPDIDDGTVLRVDIEELDITVIDVGVGPESPVVFGDALWVASTGDGPGGGAISRISLTTHDVVQVIPLEGIPGRPLVTSGALWVPNEEGGSLTRIASTTDR